MRKSQFSVLIKNISDFIPNEDYLPEVHPLQLTQLPSQLFYANFLNAIVRPPPPKKKREKLRVQAIMKMTLLDETLLKRIKEMEVGYFAYKFGK